jgi:hypothetical protein
MPERRREKKKKKKRERSKNTFFIGPLSKYFTLSPVSNPEMQRI